MPANRSKSESGGLASLIRDAGQRAKATAELRNPDPQVVVGELEVPEGPRAYTPRIFNVLEYMEAPWGLNMKPWPAQRFIVKLYYGIPLEDKVKTITVTDMFNTKVLHTFTEKEYLKFLYQEGRCNIGEQDHERRELILAIGRRGSKTTLSGIFASYEIYRLLNLHNPQGYYGLPNGNRIQIISVATDKDQAGILFNEVTGHLAKCEYFQPYVANNTQTYIQFRTPYDIDRYGPTARHENGKFVSFNGKASIRVTFKSCIAKGLRGAGNIVVILDEVAHFQDKGSSSAKDIYDAVTPSTAAFSAKNPDTGMPIYGANTPSEARIILISSPLNKTGKFYDQFHLAMSRGPGSENLLAIQAPTWEINPTVNPAYYKQKFHADPAVFMTEHGAEFSDRVRGWIEREVDLMACVEPDRKPVDIGIPRYPHSMGIDVGLMDDGTSVFISHVEGDRVVIDYHEYWQAGIEWTESNPHLEGRYSCDYARRIANVERLDFDEIAEWIHKLTKKFYISDAIFDRWNGLPLEQALHKKGLSQFRSEFFQRDVTSKMYQSVKMLIFDKKLALYNWPRPQGAKHSPFIQELLSLQAQQMSKNIVVVAAPETAGHHDDMSDAFVRSVWLSSERLRTQKVVYGGSRPGTVSAGRPMTPVGYQRIRARKHGVMTDRMNPRRIGMGRKMR